MNSELRITNYELRITNSRMSTAEWEGQGARAIGAALVPEVPYVPCVPSTENRGFGPREWRLQRGRGGPIGLAR